MRIVVKDLSIAFGRRTVFSEFSATFESQSVTALVGPSGSGKSSLLAAMAGYQRFKTGSIKYEDPVTGDLVRPSPDLVSWVPQGLNALGARSALDNVMIGGLSRGQTLHEAREAAYALLGQVGLADASERQARLLSGGELQRVAFARALASGKSLIFADEPSANLDESNTLTIAGLLADLSQKATVVVATHDPILVASSERQINLRLGL